jgi:hypothetical protein
VPHQRVVSLRCRLAFGRVSLGRLRSSTDIHIDLALTLQQLAACIGSVREVVSTPRDPLILAGDAAAWPSRLLDPGTPYSRNRPNAISFLRICETIVVKYPRKDFKEKFIQEYFAGFAHKPGTTYGVE